MEWLSQFLPEQASAMGTQVDALFVFLLGMGVFFSVLIASLVVVFAVRYRRRSHAERPQPIEGSLALELTWTLIPLAIGADAPGKEILHPVAITILGGLISATLLDTLVTPVLFHRFGRTALMRLRAEAADRATAASGAGRRAATETF